MTEWENGAPGSDEALAAGCKCPVLDNGHGRGVGGDGEARGWWISEDCPLHRPTRSAVRTEDELRDDALSASDLAKRPIREVGDMPSPFLDAP